MHSNPSSELQEKTNKASSIPGLPLFGILCAVDERNRKNGVVYQNQPPPPPPFWSGPYLE